MYQLRRFFASKNELLRRYFAFCVEIWRRKSPEKIAEKDCDAKVASKIRRKIYIASFIFDAIKKIDFIENHIFASKIRRIIKFASKNRRESLRRGNDANKTTQKIRVEFSTQIQRMQINCVYQSTQYGKTLPSGTR